MSGPAEAAKAASRAAPARTKEYESLVSQMQTSSQMPAYPHIAGYVGEYPTHWYNPGHGCVTLTPSGNSAIFAASQLIGK